MKTKNIKKEKANYSKLKYIIFLILNIILLFLVTTVLLTCMMLRNCIKSSDIPKAIGKVILEEIKIEQDDGSEKSIPEYIADELIQIEQVSEEDIEELMQRIIENKIFSDYIIFALCEDIYNGKIVLFIHIAVSLWIEILLAILMLLLLAWLIIIHKKANKKNSIALKIYSITAGFPCIIMFLFGLVITWIFKFIHLPSELGIALRGKTVFISGMGILICLSIFIFSIFRSFMENKLESKLQIPVQEEFPKTEILNRKFCRYCGEKLVNNNAEFCYQCNKKQ